MKKIVFFIVGLCALCCCVACEEKIPQKKTWTTATSEKAYEIFPKYGEKAINFFENVGIKYSITNQKVVEDEDYTWFENDFCLDDKYNMSYYLTWNGTTPEMSSYYIKFTYTTETVEELSLADNYFGVMYDINNFSTAGADTFKGSDFYKQKFNGVYQEIVKNNERAFMEYNNSNSLFAVQWIKYKVDIRYNNTKDVYEVEIMFTDYLADDNVEN